MSQCAVFLEFSRKGSDSFRLCANMMHKITYIGVISLKHVLCN